MKKYTLLGIILIVTGLVYGVVKYTYAKKKRPMRSFLTIETYVLCYQTNVLPVMDLMYPR